MKTTNIKEVKTKSVFFNPFNVKIPSLDRITMPERTILKILVTYHDEKKPVEVFNIDSDENGNKLIREQNQFMEDNGLYPFLTNRDIIAFSYLEANKYIERKSHDKMDYKNRELKETIEGLENKIKELEQKNNAMRKELRLDEPIMRHFKFKGDKKI